MLILHVAGLLNLASYVSMEISTSVGDQAWVNHHGCAMFPFPNASKNTITDESNCTYSDDISIQGDKDDDVVEDTPQLEAAVGAPHGYDGYVSGTTEVSPSSSQKIPLH